MYKLFNTWQVFDLNFSRLAAVNTVGEDSSYTMAQEKCITLATQ